MKKFGRMIGEKFKMLIRGTWTGAKWSYSGITNERFFRFFIIASILWLYFVELGMGGSQLEYFFERLNIRTY
jgi:hypothetical protein